MNTVIFDDHCSLCLAIKNKLERIDRRKKFSWIGSNEYMKLENIHPNINQRMVNSTLVIINHKNDILTDFFACRYIMSKILIFYPIVPLFYIPFISSYIGNKLYKKIAKSRDCSFNFSKD